MRIAFITLIGLFLAHGFTHGQQKYWIYPKVKMHEKEALKEHAENLKLRPIIISEWLNSYSTILTNEDVVQLRNSEHIESIEPINKKIKLFSERSNDADLGRALKQIHADTLLALGLSGKGVKIGIIDAGFLGADRRSLLESIIQNDQILGYKNYIETEITDPYGGSLTNNDSHGTTVFEFLAGKNASKQLGLAYNAQFYLARTDQADKEYHGEEDYWVAALEWLHGEGVRLVNSSLGYSDGFDDPSTDYSQEQVNGEFSAITRAAEIAIKEKGMTIVISAGNDGNKDFEIISIPADTDGIISVGSSGFRYWNKLNYSSVGPEHLDAVKPELACFASGGTSFAAPIITGVIACMKEFEPNLTNDQILSVLKKSGHLYKYPNNYLGYGVPDLRKVIKLIGNPDQDLLADSVIHATDEMAVINLERSSNIMAFHKKDDYIVLSQEKLNWRDGRVVVYRQEETQFTTVSDGISIWEVVWNNE